MGKKISILTPIDLTAAVAVKGGAFRKQVLPFGTIDYKGQKITFDKKMLTSIASAFRGKAYDQVPIVLADSENRHNMDPSRFGGEITDLSVEKDGLWMTVTPTKDTRKTLKDNPRLGVSARIVPGLTKSDGRRFDFAIQHVLLTMDPRVTGMKPWQTVDLSADDNRKVVDLTAGTIKENVVGKKNDKTKSAAEVTPEQEEVVVTEPKAKKAKEQEEVTDVRDLSDEEVDALLSDIDESNPGGDDDDEDSTDLSSSTDKTIDLAGGAIGANDTLRDEVQSMRIDLAAERWTAERKAFVEAGVPPFLLDLAAPILSTPDAVVFDLSTAEDPIDAKATIRDLLTGVKGVVDFNPEYGHSVDLSSSDDDEDSDEARLLAEWNQYGTV